MPVPRKTFDCSFPLWHPSMHRSPRRHREPCASAFGSKMFKGREDMRWTLLEPLESCRAHRMPKLMAPGMIANVGRPYEDELLLDLTARLEQAHGPWTGPQ